MVATAERLVRAVPVAALIASRPAAPSASSMCLPPAPRPLPFPRLVLTARDVARVTGRGLRAAQLHIVQHLPHLRLRRSGGPLLVLTADLEAFRGIEQLREAFPGREWLTIEDAAYALACSADTLRRCHRETGFPLEQSEIGQERVPRRPFLTWLMQRRIPSPLEFTP